MIPLDLEHDRRHGATICGIDEAGRGPWAGAVVAAALVIPPDYTPPADLNDSKKLRPARRAALYEELVAHCRFGVGVAEAEEIDRVNILAATMLAMQRAFANLGQTVDKALIDGNRLPALACAAEALVGGDARSPAIAAASIIAKETRDRQMREWAQHYPHYGFENHMGYGTPQHQHALALHGPCPIHRRSFAPIRRLLEADAA